MSEAIAINPWRSAVSKSALLEYVDFTLRGSGQVIYMDNPLTGLLNFVAIFYGAVVAGMPAVGIGAVVATFASTATAYVLRVDRDKLRMGLYGFNGALVGCGVPTFLQPNALMWAFLILGAVVSTVVMLAISNVFATWKAPAFTFPFVLTTWFIMLAAYAFPNLVITGLPHAALTHGGAAAAGYSMGAFGFVRASLVSVSQVWFINNPISGVIFLVGLLVESRWCTFLAAMGAVIAVACAMLFGADQGAISNGLWGFTAVLTAPAIGCVFMKPNAGTLVYAAIATVFTVIVHGALVACLSPVGIPTFTFPFILTSWLFLLAQRNFEPRRSVAVAV